VSLYYYERWKTLWSLEEPKVYYSTGNYQDDTLRVVMLGDSWVGMRTDTLNCLFKKTLSDYLDRPVILKSKGKGGEKSRGIYRLMFEEDSLGTKPLLESGADYCVVFAGINDAAANLGKKQYIHHMKLIIKLLLANYIRPILIEIPDVDIWNIYGEKPIKDLVVDFVRSVMTGSGMYHFPEYRETLRLMLKDSQLLDSVIFVPMNGWNGRNSAPNEKLFLDDHIHLNHQGYLKLDSCVMKAIIRDLQ
jgi:lysophospholipase L1-like esterase